MNQTYEWFDHDWNGLVVIVTLQVLEVSTGWRIKWKFPYLYFFLDTWNDWRSLDQVDKELKRREREEMEKFRSTFFERRRVKVKGGGRENKRRGEPESHWHVSRMGRNQFQGLTMLMMRSCPKVGHVEESLSLSLLIMACFSCSINIKSWTQKEEEQQNREKKRSPKEFPNPWNIPI